MRLRVVLMRERQELITIELLETETPLNIKKLAKKLSCSERTVRNDLKTIEKWIEVNSQSKVLLKRQPGVGTYLKADDQERLNLLQLMKEYQSEYVREKDERQNKMLFNLLMNQQTTTIDELADQFFESKMTIREDLETIRQSINGHQLDLTIEPRIGIQITGDERKKRKVLAQVVKQSKSDQSKDLYLAKFFKQEDIQKINKTVGQVDPALLDSSDISSLSTIIIHLLFMIERIKKKSTLQLTTEEKSILSNTDAYSKSEKITELLSQQLGLVFPEDEVGYLGLHIASLEMNQNRATTDSREKIAETVEEVIELLIQNVSEILNVKLADDPILKRNLTAHLNSAILRVISDFHISNPLLEEIKHAYAHLFLIIQFILEDYAESYGMKFPEEEVAYLTVHFKAALERIKEEKQEYKAIITCDYGIGVSSFLEAKINRSFPELKIVDLVNYEELQIYPLENNIDLIISTKEISIVKVPHIVISPMMDGADVKKMQDFVEKKQKKKKVEEFDIHKYTNTFLIEPQLDVASKEACLSFMCEQLEKKGYITHHYKNTVFTREESSSTLIAPLVAIPHGNTKYVEKSGIYIASLKEPVEWGNGKAQLILLLALHKEDLGLTETKKIFSVLHELTEDKERLDNLLARTTQLEIMQDLGHYHSN